MRFLLFVFLVAVPAFGSGPLSTTGCPYHLWAAAHVPPNGEYPVVVGKVPLTELFARGHATMEMEPWMLEAFGPNGPGMGWMPHIPNGTQFVIPVSPEGEWKFYPQNPRAWNFAWGANPELDRELKEVLAPLARRLAASVIGKMGNMVSNGDVVVVKNSFGL